MKYGDFLLNVACLLTVATWSHCQTTLSAQSGVTVISLDAPALQGQGILLDLTKTTDSSGGPAGFGFVQVPKGKAHVVVHDGTVALGPLFSLAHVGGFVLSKQDGVLKINNFSIRAEGNTAQIILPPGDLAVLTFDIAKLRYLPQSDSLVLEGADLKVAKAGAKALHDISLVGKRLGTITLRTTLRPVSNQELLKTGTRSSAFDGPDLTICALDSLAQFARDGNVAGLALSTTSWNVGNQRLDWYRYPSWRHPVIARNLYRVSEDKIEQVGEGAVKHGFFALSDGQCGSGCTDHTDGTQLGVGCTDTYNAFTTADQGSLAPRYEVNPWTGFFDPLKSHLKSHHSHNPAEHLLRVHDSDLDFDSTYVVEAYYVQYQDANPMNNSAWKPVRVVSGKPGGEWKFEMTPEEVAPNIGFAIDSWHGAQRSVVAEDDPPQKGHSPDGRLLVASKVKDLGNGSWRYEYAVYNVDMDRAMKSLTIPVPKEVRVWNITFHAAEHEADELNIEDGVQTDNAPWNTERLPDSVTWRTSSNPLRWGTLYNFGFTADAGPRNVAAGFGLFRAGTPPELPGQVQAPASH
jgi:hypothetical protein